MTTAVLVVLAFATQRALTWPGVPWWGAEVLIPMVFIVAPAVRFRVRRWPYLGVAVGLAWDLVMEPVIGPGGIAWSAAGLAIAGAAGVIADRSPRAWVGLGALGTITVLLVHQLALLPLGIARAVPWLSAARSVVLTAAWCGVVGSLIVLDLPSRWRRYRARRLR